MGTVSNLIDYINEFGLKIFLSKAIRKCFYNGNSKLAWRVNEYNEKLIESYLQKQFENTEYNVLNDLQFCNSSVPKKPIWIMWWQGEKQAPEIVRCCINSVRRYCNNHEVIVVTETNISDYIKLPEFILKKVDSGCITRTHLSDLIRLALLYTYGGAWIDATVLVTQNIPEELFQKKFYSVNFGIKTKDPSHGRWTTFLLFGEKRNKLFRQVLEYHYRYWCKHDIIVDYIMFDYIINYVIKTDEECYNQIYDIPLNGCCVFDLMKIINDPITRWDMNSLERDTIFYKLSYKHALIEVVNGEKTIYGKLIEEFLTLQ